MKPIQNIFDLHCDTLTECHRLDLSLNNDKLHFSLDLLPRDYRLCQCMAIFMRDGVRGQAAEEYFDQVYAYYRGQLEQWGDLVVEAKPGDSIPSLLEQKPFVFLLTVEGGSALAGRLENVEKLARRGVRMMTLTWNGENELCGGVRAKTGFTPFGRRAIPRMEELGIVVDVSHLNDRSFYQLCEFARRPFVASHSNARSVCANPRNLTDDMFRIIRDRGGIVGLNYYNNFVVDQGESSSIADLLRHAHHFLELGGEKTLALGSDFDGADIPPYLDSLSKVDVLGESLERSGIPGRMVQDILFHNANRFFEQYNKAAQAPQALNA